MAKTYDPSKNKVSFAGIRITGFMKGTFISVKRQAAKWVFEPGVAGGEGVYVKQFDDSAILELTLQSTSPSNTDLSNQYKKDKRDNSGKGAVSVEDLNTTNTLFAGAECRIMTCPDYERGDALTPAVWQIHISKLSDEFIDGASA